MAHPFNARFYGWIIILHGAFWIAGIFIRHLHISLLFNLSIYTVCVLFPLPGTTLIWKFNLMCVYLNIFFNLLVGRTCCCEVLLWQENSWMPWRWRRWVLFIIIHFSFFIYAHVCIIVIELKDKLLHYTKIHLTWFACL